MSSAMFQNIGDFHLFWYFVQTVSDITNHISPPTRKIRCDLT